MKIRFLIANAYGVGGTIKTTYNLAGALAERGHDVQIVSLQRDRAAPAFSVPPGVRLRPLSDRTQRTSKADDRRTDVVGRSKVELKRWARRRPSRLIHQADSRYERFDLFTDFRLAQFILSLNDGVLIGTRGGLNVAIARLARRSVVRVGQEHLNLRKYSAEFRAAFKEYYPRLDAYSTLTERDGAAYRKLLGSEARVVTIPNGIPRVDGLLSDTTGNVVLAAGRLTSQKGFDRLIPAWGKVAEQHPDWELRIFGSGKKKKPLRRLIEELNVDGSTRLMGYTSELPREMARASFYVMSSRFEGFPMVLLEAMASGLPVVSFDCPNGPRDLIEHGEDGFLVPNGDVDALAAALNEMIELGDARRSFGEAAVRKSQRYELSAVAARWEELLQELVDAHARRGPLALTRARAARAFGRGR